MLVSRATGGGYTCLEFESKASGSAAVVTGERFNGGQNSTCHRRYWSKAFDIRHKRLDEEAKSPRGPPSLCWNRQVR